MKNKKAEKIITGCFIAALLVLLVLFVVFDLLKKDVRESEKFSVSMGTVVSQKIYSEKDESTACDEIAGLIDSLEDRISWRTKGSDIYVLNNSYSLECDGEMKSVFEKCADVFTSSRGAFDITVGGLTSLWKIGEDDARVPSEGEIKSALAFVDSSKMKISDEKVSIGKGQLVDLGAVGKGLACDEVRKYLDNTDISGAVVSVGGSVLLYGENPSGKPWSVAVRNPRGESTEYMGVLLLDNVCVSTSGDYERVLVSDGKTYHHILNPKTGYPSQSGLISVTVVCDSGLMSDALSTACFVLGREEGMKLLKKYDAEGVFIDTDMKVYITDGLRDVFSLTDENYILSGEEK